MSGFLGLFGAPGEKAGARMVYSIEHLQQLFHRLHQFRDMDDQNRDAMVEVIRQITEALIWGEKHDHNLFDYFCEKNMLAHFVHLLNRPAAPRIVIIQLLQTLSILVQNIRRDTSLYYLFSNNYVNQLISARFDWSDEETLSYYISFLKSLALRLNAETVKFFFNERLNQFPLYIQAVRFFSHHDGMVRAAVRTLTFQVYRIDDANLRRFLLDKSSLTYFVHLSCYMRELWGRLDQVSVAAAAGGEQVVPHALQELYEEQTDLFMYLSDVLELGVPELSETLAECILHRAIFPAILGSLLATTISDRFDTAQCARSETMTIEHSKRKTSIAKVSGTDTNCSGDSGGAGIRSGRFTENTSRPLGPACALFILRQVLDTFRSRVLIEPLVTALLMQPLSETVRKYCRTQPATPQSYRGSFLADGLFHRSTSWAPVESADDEPIPMCGDAGGEGDEFGDGEQITHADSVGALIVEASSPVETLPSNSVGTPPARVELAVVEGLSLRSRLYAYLGATDAVDVLALLSAGILQLCVRHRELLPPALLDDSRLLPTTPRRRGLQLLYCSRGRTPPKTLDHAVGHPLEALFRAACALERHGALRTVVVQGLCAFVFVISRELDPELRGLALEPLGRASRSAARQAHTHLGGTLGDAFLDVFSDEWELSRVCVNGLGSCENVRCLLPSVEASTSLPVKFGRGVDALFAPPEWTRPASHSEWQIAAKAVRSLLVIYRLYSELASLTTPAAVPRTKDAADGDKLVLAACVDATESPLHIAGELSEGYQEGRSFQLGRQDRIVCGVVTAEGRHTRYLVLHRFLLMLVQPDLVSPGWAAVRTLAALRHVESQIDHNDARMLKIVGRLHRGASCPGEASPCDVASFDEARGAHEDQRTATYFTLSLSFEDGKRCHFADMHLRTQRKEVRAELRQRVDSFIRLRCE